MKLKQNMYTTWKGKSFKGKIQCYKAYKMQKYKIEIKQWKLHASEDRNDEKDGK